MRREHGPNALPDVRANVVLMFARKLFSPIPLLMVATLIVAALLKDYVTTACVAVLLLVNAVLGTVQEIRAHNAMRTLRASLIMTARVVRDGTPQQVASSDLVPGDIVRVRLGDSVPADVTVTTVADLMYDDSTITGESLPHAAQRGDELLCGSAIVRGEALCTVVRTGARSRTAARLELIKRSNPRDHSMRSLLVYIGTLVGVVSLLVTALIVSAVLRGVPLEPLVPLFVLLFVIGFPIALPTMLLVASTLGSNAAGKRGILVKRLGALVDAASMDVLCCDKTGTLTENRLVVSDVIVAARISAQHFGHPLPVLLADARGDAALTVLVAARLCCNVDNLDPIDTAIVNRLAPVWAQVHSQFATLAFEPFSSASHRTGATVRLGDGGSTALVSKGSVDAILALCHCSAEAASATNAFADALTAERGCRVLGVAHAGGDSSGEPLFQFVGLLALDDVVRSDSAATIAALHSSGVRVVMITGDRASVAHSVMQAVGIGGSVVSPPAAFASEQVRHQFWSDSLIAGELACAAGVKPEDKHAIVVALQRRGHIVGMTGDGANDAAALKQAEVGVAVDTSVDLAKLSASTILLVGGISSIASLVSIGRTIHQRLQTFMLLKASKMFQTVLFVVVIFAAEGVVAIEASHVATMMFLMDLTVATIATDHQLSHALPARRNLRFVVLVSVALGTLSCLELIAFFYFARLVLGYRDQPEAALRALMFLVNFVLASLRSTACASGAGSLRHRRLVHCLFFLSSRRSPLLLSSPLAFPVRSSRCPLSTLRLRWPFALSLVC